MISSLNKLRPYLYSYAPFIALVLVALLIFSAVKGYEAWQSYQTAKRLAAAQAEQTEAQKRGQAAEIDLARINQQLETLKTDLAAFGNQIEQLNSERAQLRNATANETAKLANLRAEFARRLAAGLPAGEPVSVADACAAAAAIGHPCR